MTEEQYIEHFTSVEWGRHYEDDKYFDDELLEDSFIVFYTYVFAHLGLPRPTIAQYEMALFISDGSNAHRMMIAQRGLSKSLTSQIYVTHRLLNDVNEKVLVMSAGKTRAGNYSQFVQKLIKMLPITKHMTPRHNMERTSGESFDVAGASPSDSPSVYAVGAATQVTGFRASLIVYDDIETAQTVESAVKSEMIDVYAMEAQNLLMSGKDESITLCTPHSTNSIYIPWIEEKGFKPFIIPAYYLDPTKADVHWGGIAPYLIERVKKDPSLIGQAVDERLNKEFLESKKMRVGKSKFKLQYEIDVTESDAMKHPLKLSDLIVMDVDDEIAPLKISYSSMPDNILYQKHNGFSKDKLYMPRYVSDETGAYDIKIMSIDTAGMGADEIGISLLYALGTRIFIKKVIGFTGGYGNENMVEIAEMCAIHSIDVVVVEDNFGDGMFKKLLEPHILKHSPRTDVEGIKVTGQKEVRIIEALEPIMNQHRLVVSKEVFEHDVTVKTTIYSFGYQLSRISRARDSLKHDDRLDSVANGVTYLMEYLADDEDRIMEYHVEQEAQKVLEYTLGRFQNKQRQGNLNFGQRF